MRVSIIISYYRSIDNLQLVFDGLKRQSSRDFEVIVSEDDCHAPTEEFLQLAKRKYSFPIKHLHQKEDLGFRKTMMLNQSIKSANGSLLVFIDGDCIPHKHFVLSYAQQAVDGNILYGRRVMLSEKLSKQLLTDENIDRLSFTNLILQGAKKLKEYIYWPAFDFSFKQRGLMGCNWGVLKSHLMAVNGFDEDYQHAGVGEDVDIEWRLKEHGLKMVSMKNKAIICHIHHPRSYQEKGVMANYDLLAKKKEAGHIYCLNGLSKS